MNRLLGIASLLLLVGCSEGRVVEMLPETVETEVVEVAETVDNPFQQALSNLDDTLTDVERLYYEMLLLEGGIEVVGILHQNISIEKKVSLLFALDDSDAKRLFFAAAGNEISTITKLMAVYDTFVPGQRQKNATLPETTVNVPVVQIASTTETQQAQTGNRLYVPSTDVSLRFDVVSHVDPNVLVKYDARFYDANSSFIVWFERDGIYRRSRSGEGAITKLADAGVCLGVEIVGTAVYYMEITTLSLRLMRVSIHGGLAKPVDYEVR